MESQHKGGLPKDPFNTSAGRKTQERNLAHGSWHAVSSTARRPKQPCLFTVTYDAFLILQRLTGKETASMCLRKNTEKSGACWCWKQGLRSWRVGWRRWCRESRLAINRTPGNSRKALIPKIGFLSGHLCAKFVRMGPGLPFDFKTLFGHPD